MKRARRNMLETAAYAAAWEVPKLPMDVSIRFEAQAG